MQTFEPKHTEIFASVLDKVNSGMELDRRHFDRAPCRLQIQVQSVTESLEDFDAPFTAVSSDISTSGLGIVSPILPTSPYIRVSVPGTDSFAFAKVIHSTNIGDDYPQYLIGAEFLRP